jgi:hypothetical protein
MGTLKRSFLLPRPDERTIWYLFKVSVAIYTLEDLFNIAAPGLRCHLIKSSLILISASHSTDRSSSTAIMCRLRSAINHTVPYRTLPSSG